MTKPFIPFWRILLVVVLLSVLCLPSAYTQETPGVNDTISLDPRIRTGTLANGFTYYIRKNTEPKERVFMYLAMKVGSILEEENQRGLAHFLEHMNFNGTTHFPKNELVDYLQKSGVRFGADLNAYTSFDETVYQLPIPSDDPEILENGLQIMRDWAQEALLDPEEIDKERGVVLEEKRLRSGAGQRMRDQYFPQLLNNSRYAQRMPIGTEEVLTQFEPETLRQFHWDWYRPDLQALVVVGDIEVDEMEKKIRSLFADLKNPPNSKERIKYTVELNGENQYIRVTDAEMPATVVQVYMKHPEDKLITRADFRQAMVRALYNLMMETRFDELQQQPDPPFLAGGSSVGEFIGGLDALTTSVQSRPGALEQGFKAVMTEIERVDHFGFTASELARAKKNQIAFYESLLEEKNKIHSKNLVEEYVRHFLEEEAAPGIEREYDLVNELMEKITLEEVNRAARNWISHRNRDILLLAPDKEKATLPDEATLYSWISEVQASAIEPYQDNMSDEPLLELSQLSGPGSVVDRQKLPDIEVTELTLDNGVKVILKSTDFKNDQVLFNAFSPGGSSLYNDEDFFSASSAAAIVGRSGVGPFDALQLERYMAGKRVAVVPYINEREEGLSGSSTLEDLETMMQLIYQYFNAPNKDEEVFQSIISRQKGYLANRGEDPSQVFEDTVAAVLSDNSIRRSALTLEKLEMIDLDEAYTIYNERFADAGDFTFVFVGSFDPGKIMPLIGKYLGALPTSGREEQPKDLNIRIPEGKLYKAVYKGLEDKATVKLVLSGDYTYNEEENLELEALGEVLQIMLTERLRELEGGVYSPGVRVHYSKYPESRYSFTITFGCAPENVEKLISATGEEIDKLKSEGPALINIQKFVAEEQRDIETQLRNNGFWLSYLTTQYLNEEDPLEVLGYSASLEELTAKRLKVAARKYLNEKNYIRMVLLPENLNN